MAELTQNCPRCFVKHTTFSVLSNNGNAVHRYSELFCVCKNCHRSVVFIAYIKGSGVFDSIRGKSSVNISSDISDVNVVRINPEEIIPSPDFIPEDIKVNFDEGAMCYSIGCHNAAATMFRLCLDKATKSFLPEEPAAPPAKIRRSLGLRMDWLFEHGHLPVALKELAECIKDDGNDGAHEGILSKVDVDDLIDFTISLLERLYTEPRKIELAKERRLARRQQQ